MPRLLTSRRLRWAVPAIVATGVAAAALTATNGAGASEQPRLPALTAAQLLVKVQQVHPTNLSGTIVETASLGLPALPSGDIGGASGLSLESLLTGSHTMRVWYGGPDQQRVAVLAPMSERDIIHNGSDLWTYTSTTNEVTHATVGRLPAASAPDPTISSPQQAAVEALRAIDPTTSVRVDRTARVAGRAAYQLDLAPKDPRSLIGTVRIAIDAATSTPLRVQIFPAGSSAPAIQVGFTDISFNAPNPSVFSFAPPAGATISQQKAPGTTGSREHSSAGRDGMSRDGQHPSVLGAGWTAVVELPTSGHLGSYSDLLKQMSTRVPGGQLITTSLVSVLVTDDGHVFAGAVSGAALQTVAATGHGL